MVWRPVKCILRPNALFTNKAKGAFLITLCYILLFFMTCTSQFRHWIGTAVFTKGISIRTSLINILCL